MKVKIITDKLESFKEVRDIVYRDFSNFVKDKSIPLEERWSLFEKAIEDYLYSNEKTRVWDISKYDKHLSFYDNLYIERYSVVTLPHLFILLEEYFTENNKEVDLAEIQEEMLESGYTHFTFDW